MRLLLLIVLLVLAAGCLGQPASETAVDADAADEGRTSRLGNGDDGQGGGHYLDSAPLVLDPNPLITVAVGGVSSANCVLFWDTKGADYSIVNGTVTMSWDAVTPLAETLALDVSGASGPALSAQGSSPLVIDLAGAAADDWGLAFMGHAPTGSVAVRQDFTLAFDFTYEGDLPSPGYGSCSTGFP